MAHIIFRNLSRKKRNRNERQLLALCRNNPNHDKDVKKWNKTAIKFLINKFKKNLDVIEELEKAILSESPSTKCVPCPKTLDNRLLVSHRKALPQVIYCRLWRWPDLQSHHQIKPIQTCDSCTDSTETVCVNPYHYERNKPPSIDPILVPYSQIPPDLSTSFEDSDPVSTRNSSRGIMLPTTITGETVRSLLSPTSPKLETVARPYQFKKNKFTPLVRAMHEQSILGNQSSYDQQGYATYSQQGLAQYVQHQPSYHPQDQYVQPHTSYQAQQLHSTASHSYPQQVQQPPHQQYETIYSQQQEQYPQEQYIHQEQYPQQDHMQLHYQNQGVPLSPLYRQSVYNQPVAGSSRNHDPQPMQEQPAENFQKIRFVEDPCWCSISYHEFDQSIGAKYQTSHFTVCVDGYTHPNCSDRFCIGGLSNVNRNDQTVMVRRKVGKGVKLTYVDGEVFVECLSDASIFISTPIIQDSVSKITHGSSMKVFTNALFSKLLSDAVSRGFEDVYKLTNYCTFRVSFVKGWGRNYKRQTIMNTPCWVEVQLNGPLLWIDEVLRQMRPPQGGCGSTS